MRVLHFEMASLLSSEQGLCGASLAVCPEYHEQSHGPTFDPTQVPTREPGRTTRGLARSRSCRDSAALISFATPLGRHHATYEPVIPRPLPTIRCLVLLRHLRDAFFRHLQEVR